MAIGYCRCLRLSVRPCVNHLLVRAIIRDPFKLWSQNLHHRCKRPWLRSLFFFFFFFLGGGGGGGGGRWGGDWIVTFKVKFTFKAKFTPFWACPCGNSSSVQARTAQFGPDGQNTLVKIPVVLGVDWAWHVKFNLFSKSCTFASLLRLWDICETCKNGWKWSLFHILHGCAHKSSPTVPCHGPWNSRVVSLVWPLLASKSPTRRLAMDFWLLL